MPYRFHLAILVISLVFVGSVSAEALLNANSASGEELAVISQLDDNTIAAIIDRRPFATVGELNAVLSNSMGAEEIEALFRKLFIPINLNTALRQDILLIPGVGPRMAHEFEEYRPYSSIEQF